MAFFFFDSLKNIFINEESRAKRKPIQWTCEWSNFLVHTRTLTNVSKNIAIRTEMLIGILTFERCRPAFLKWWISTFFCRFRHRFQIYKTKNPFASIFIKTNSTASASTSNLIFERKTLPLPLLWGALPLQLLLLLPLQLPLPNRWCGPLSPLKAHHLLTK